MWPKSPPKRAPAFSLQPVTIFGSLLHGLLDLSSFATGHFVPQLQFVALDKIVASVCDEYERPAIDKGLKFIRRLQAIGLISDPVVIGRIVRNLVDNAIKYTDEGEICVELQHHDEGSDRSAVLTVADTGRGIPESEQARIFEEFYQLDNPGRDRTKGVGLGLAIVQRLCEAVGTRIEVQSEHNKGSTFLLRFSGALESSASHQAKNSAPQFSVLNSRRVYVIDDEIDVVRSMTQLLKVWGADVLVPDSVGQVDELFAAHGPPHLLITDYRLGQAESGAALAARLRNEYGAFPVVVITGDVGLQLSTRDDPHEFVVAFKPVTAEGLQIAIGAAFTGTGSI
jgi:CheY-like chemotaxis protein